MSIIFDFADIASRVKNPNQIFPKAEIKEGETLVKPSSAYKEFLRQWEAVTGWEEIKFQ